MDAENPRAELIALITNFASGSDASEEEAASTIVAAIGSGSEASVVIFVSILEHSMDVLGTLSASAPRRGRKALLELMDRVEGRAREVGWGFSGFT